MSVRGFTKRAGRGESEMHRRERPTTFRQVGQQKYFMSVRALAWVFQQQIKPATCKLILLAFADCVSEHELKAFPCQKTLERMTNLDRKTVQAGIAKLEELGWIEDTKERVGRTAQVKVYRIKGLTSPEMGALDGQRTPFFPPKVPVFPAKGAQKRDTEPKEERLKEQEEDPGKPGASYHAEFVKLWHERHLEVFGERYIMAGAKDGAAAKRLFASCELTPAELIGIAEAAWQHRNHPKAFYSKHASSIAGFVSQINNIRAELKDLGACPAAGPQKERFVLGGNHD